jgi:ribosomal protein S18 acetylase RimI-like enzyme
MIAATVRPLDGCKRDEILAVTARAFWHDPLFDFFTRNLLDEYRLLPRLFASYFKDVEGPKAEVWAAEVSGRPRGVAGWIMPGGLPRSHGQEFVRSLRALAMIAHCKHRSRALRLLTEVERRHPHDAHWYLSILATDPTVQGRGLGTALLDPVLRRCDKEGLLAYTETQKQENVSWYRRAGFEVADVVSIGDSPTIWCLRREPVPAEAS